ncbi:MAG: dihydrolipoyl dehydrogenase [Chitinophagales bacterium]
MTEQAVDLIVVGGGPAGYVAALRGAQLGARVQLIEEAALGGTCLNVGCIPTKTLLHSAHLYTEIKKAKTYGIEVQGASLNLAAVLARKDQVVRRLTGGVAGLLRQAGVEVVKGKARLVAKDRVALEGPEPREVAARAVLIATGSETVDLPIARLNGRNIVGSTEALSLPEVPPRLLIIGGGVIGCEFASIYQAFGSQVTIIEAEEQLLPREDPEIAGVLARELARSGVTVLTAARLQSLAESGEGRLTATVKGRDGAERLLEAEVALVSVGRRPRVAGLGLEALGVKVERSGIVVDERGETTVKGVFAAGDVTGGWQLAHVAFHEGAAAAENALGRGEPLRLRAVPRCVYTSPEVASVGLSEPEAQKVHGTLKVGRFPFAANGKALAMGETAGLVKVIAEAHYDQVVGVAIVGPGATELVGEAALAIAQECTLAELIEGVHAHPTLTEALREAALAAAGRPLHTGHERL